MSRPPQIVNSRLQFITKKTWRYIIALHWLRKLRPIKRRNSDTKGANEMSDFHLLLEDQLPRLMRYAAALTRDGEQAGELVEETVIEALRRSWPRGADLRIALFAVLHELRGNPFRQADPAATSTAIVTDPA